MAAFYQLVKAFGRQLKQKAILDEIDVGDIPLVNISKEYYDVYFIIQTPIFKQPKVLYLKEIPMKMQISRMSLNQWLESIGNKTLPLVNDIPEHVRGEVYCWDAFQWGFKYKRLSSEDHPLADIPEEDKQDIRLYKKGVKDHYLMGSHSLVSINGLFHYHTYDQDGWIIRGAGKTINKQKDTTFINILDFTQVGEVACYPIKEEMIIPLKPGYPLHEGFYLNSPVSFINKTVGIVIGGYFHLLDHTYRRVSEQRLKIHFNNLRWETLYYQMKRLIDISSISLTDFGNDRVLGFELYHDKTIRSLMTMNQSFIVTIRNPYVSIQEEQVGHTGLPGRYETGIKPIYPLRIGEGRYPAYKVSKDGLKWSLSVHDNFCPRQVRYQDEKDTFHMIHDRVYPIFGEAYANAHFIRIFGDRTLTTRVIDPYFEPMNKKIHDLKQFATKAKIDDLPFRNSTRTEYYKVPKIVDVDFTDDYWQPKPTPLEKVLDQKNK